MRSARPHKYIHASPHTLHRDLVIELSILFPFNKGVRLHCIMITYVGWVCAVNGVRCEKKWSPGGLLFPSTNVLGCLTVLGGQVEALMKKWKLGQVSKSQTRGGM